MYCNDLIMIEIQHEQIAMKTSMSNRLIHTMDMLIT